MKTFARLIWRYVLTAVGVVLLLLVLTISLLGWISWREGYLQPQREYSYSEIADSMVETDNGMIFGAEHAPEEWMDGYAWAMILDEKGNVKWNYDRTNWITIILPATSPVFPAGIWMIIRYSAGPKIMVCLWLVLPREVSGNIIFTIHQMFSRISSTVSHWLFLACCCWF